MAAETSGRTFVLCNRQNAFFSFRHTNGMERANGSDRRKIRKTQETNNQLLPIFGDGNINDCLNFGFVMIDFNFVFSNIHTYTEMTIRNRNFGVD